MGKKEASSLHAELVRGEKKLSKREQRLRERLEKAREAMQCTEERLLRTQVRLEKRSARVKRLETKLEQAHAQLQEIEIKVATHGTSSDAQSAEHENAGTTAQVEAYSPQEQLDDEIEIQVFRQPVDDLSGAQRVDDTSETDLSALAESIVQAQDARNVAESAESAARIAVERAQAAEERLNDLGSARHLGPELVQMQDEAEQAVQRAQEMEQVAREAEQQLWPLTLQDIDEPEEDDSQEN